MKKCRFSTSDRVSLVPFLAFHILVIAICLICFLISPRKILTNFMDIIPNNGLSESMKAAEKSFTDAQNNNVVIYVGSENRDRAKSVAAALEKELKASNLMDDVTTDQTDINLTELQNYISENSMYLLDEDVCKELEADPEKFAEDSLARIFGGFTLSSLNNLEADPFLLSDFALEKMISQLSTISSFSPDDGYLIEEFDGKSWVMLNCRLNEQSTSVANNTGISDFFTLCDRVQSSFPDCEIVYSGIPLHSGESSANAQSEITIITSISIIAMLILLFLTCKNLKILKLFLISFSLSAISAVCTLIICFKEPHIMTFLFGTTVIGSCIDYSIHFYVRYARKGKDETATDVRSQLIKSLSISFLSTVVCYLLLLFSNYSLLRQISVFSISGLLSAFLSAMYLYPNLIKPGMVNGDSFISTPDRKTETKPWVVFSFAAVVTIAFFVCLPSLKIENNISSLYTPSERMMRNEARASEIIGYDSATYGIIAADTESDALEIEEEIINELDGMIADGKLSGYVATASFIPSVSRQMKSLKAVRCLLPYVDDQCEILEISKEQCLNYKNRLMDDSYLSLDSLPDSIRGLISSFSLGKVGDKYCEAIILRDVNANDEVSALFEKYADAHYFQTAVDVNRQLNQLTGIILKLLVIAFFVVLIALMVIYSPKIGFRMALTPYCIIITSLTVSRILGFTIDFFYIVGLVLSIGLGLDYIVFSFDGKKSNSNKAVLLSFITTELSFGSLIFSSFRPVHIFGFSVFIGILTAYILSLVTSRTE